MIKLNHRSKIWLPIAEYRTVRVPKALSAETSLLRPSQTRHRTLRRSPWFPHGCGNAHTWSGT